MRPYLEDVVLLSCRFRFSPKADDEVGDTEGGDAQGEDEFTYPDENMLQVRSVLDIEEDAALLFLQATLDDERLDFELDVEIGARFSSPEKFDLPREQVERTLVFMVFPYVRELVSNITSRSPAPPYFLRPQAPLSRAEGPAKDADQPKG
jgi:hypothetical protein